MASAGRILIMPKGDYDANSTYENLDLVKHNGLSWVAKKTVKGIEPSEENTEFWHKMFDLNIANNLTTEEAGYALDARQGKVLNNKITVANDNITSVNKNLAKYHITSVGNLNALAGTSLVATSSIVDIYNAMPAGSRLDSLYVEGSTNNYPFSWCRIDSTQKINDTSGMLVWCFSYSATEPELWFNIVNGNKETTGWISVNLADTSTVNAQVVFRPTQVELHFIRP